MGGEESAVHLLICLWLDPSAQNTPKIPLPPPIIITASLWSQVAPLIFQNQEISPIGLTAKSSSDG